MKIIFHKKTAWIRTQFQAHYKTTCVFVTRPITQTKKITQEKQFKEGHICLGSWFNKDVDQHGEKSWWQEGAAMGGIASTVRKQSVDKK